MFLSLPYCDGDSRVPIFGLSHVKFTTEPFADSSTTIRTSQHPTIVSIDQVRSV